MLDESICGTIEELAKRECVNRGYMSRALRLTLLAPDILEAILDGRQPERFRLEDLLEMFPLEWEAQHKPLAISDSHFSQSDEWGDAVAARPEMGPQGLRPERPRWSSTADPLTRPP